MLFNSFDFLWLFPIIFCTYYFFVQRLESDGKRTRMSNYFLILISYLLYARWNVGSMAILLGVTFISYSFALLISRHFTSSPHRKRVFYAGVLLALSPLLLLKYLDFFGQIVVDALSFVDIRLSPISGLNWIMPLGISFYTLQAIGYLSDVYHDRIGAERNWWNYMLFICFFPQIVSGPISKAETLLPQIKNARPFNEAQMIQGLKWLLWGMFLKVVVADRLGIVVDSIYNGYNHYCGLFCFIGSIFYSFQIYTDFAGYSFMALGVGMIMGFNLINNFNRPYLSKSITEFWHRWHISLSIWLRDYIYIPLGGNRCGQFKNRFNILLTFLVSGIWHGANWTFIIWGGIHGAIQVVEKQFGLAKLTSHGVLSFTRIVLTFFLANFAWVFFRMPTINDALMFIGKIFSDFHLSVDIDLSTIFWCLVLILIVSLKDIVDEYNIRRLRLLHHPSVAVRWSSYIIILVTILFCGVFDAGQFIYAMF